MNVRFSPSTLPENWLVRRRQSGSDVSEESGKDSASGAARHRPEWVSMPRGMAPRFTDLLEENAYLSYLERRIARNPRDLFSHSQRILLLHRQQLSPRVHDALIDLYLVLQKSGYELRKSLLLTVKNSLSRPQREFFAAHLRKGLKQEDVGGILTGALLVSGSGSCKPLVHVVGADDQQDLSEIAYVLLEQGQVDEACRVWERMLADDPGNAEATMELLSVYQHYRLKDDFFRTYMDLSGRKLAFRDLWHHLDRHFNKRATQRRR